MDYISSKCVYSTTLTGQSTTNRSCAFGNVTCDDTISDDAKLILYALGLMPHEVASKYEGDYFYWNNGQAERSFFCGGHWCSGANAGVFYLNGNNDRSNSNINIGFRSALP